jgi:hypothetical protein
MGSTFGVSLRDGWKRGWLILGCRWIVGASKDAGGMSRLPLRDRGKQSLSSVVVERLTPASRRQVKMRLAGMELVGGDA